MENKNNTRARCKERFLAVLLSSGRKHIGRLSLYTSWKTLQNEGVREKEINGSYMILGVCGLLSNFGFLTPTLSPTPSILDSRALSIKSNGASARSLASRRTILRRPWHVSKHANNKYPTSELYSTGYILSVMMKLPLGHSYVCVCHNAPAFDNTAGAYVPIKRSQKKRRPRGLKISRFLLRSFLWLFFSHHLLCNNAYHSLRL